MESQFNQSGRNCRYLITNYRIHKNYDGWVLQNKPRIRYLQKVNRVASLNDRTEALPSRTSEPISDVIPCADARNNFQILYFHPDCNSGSLVLSDKYVFSFNIIIRIKFSHQDQLLPKMNNKEFFEWNYNSK